MSIVRHVLVATVLVSGVAVATPASASASSLKPEVSGVFSRSGAPPANYLPDTAGWVVNANWADLQPTQGGPIAANNVIDQAIVQVRQINAANPAYKLRLKLRLFAGIHAPDWAKNLGGGPFTATDPISGTTGTVGRFWTRAFGTAYTDFVTRMAAVYDSVRVIGDVTISRCTTVFAEPFMRQSNDPTTVANMLAAGFSTGADVTCHRQEINDGRAFATTHVSLAFNPYQQINADGSTQTNEIFTEQMIDYCRAQLGTQCVLENNSIRSPALGGDYKSMYAKFQALGPPLAFQTAAAGRVGDVGSTLQWAVDQGANVVEWPGGGLSPSQVGSYSAALKSNPQP